MTDQNCKTGASVRCLHAVAAQLQLMHQKHGCRKQLRSTVCGRRAAAAASRQDAAACKKRQQTEQHPLRTTSMMTAKLMVVSRLHSTRKSEKVNRSPSKLPCMIFSCKK